MDKQLCVILGVIGIIILILLIVWAVAGKQFAISPTAPVPRTLTPNSQLTQAITTALEYLSKEIASGNGNIGQLADSLKSQVSSLAGNYPGVADKVSSFFQTVSDDLQHLFNSVRNGDNNWNDVVAKMKSDFSNGLSSLVNNSSSDFKSKVNTYADNLANYLKNASTNNDTKLVDLINLHQSATNVTNAANSL